MNKISLHFTAGFWIYLAALTLFLPFQWLLAWICATFFHEFCHILSLRACKIPVSQIQVGFPGMQIHTGDMSPAEAVICALSGPLGGLLLTLTMGFLPRLALCALVQSIFNLLPFYPLDGGRALRAMLTNRKIFLAK